MSKQELNDCLKSFYTSARKQDGSYYKTSSMKSIRAAIDRFLRSPPHCKQFSIIGDPAFTEANQVLDAFVKDLRKTGKIAGVVHKKPITKQQIQRLYECGELGPANSTNPAQLQRTVWFYLVLYFGQRGRENQRQMKSNMLVFRKTPQGKEYCELNKEVAGSVSSTKNHQGGFTTTKTIRTGKYSLWRIRQPAQSKPSETTCPILIQSVSSFSNDHETAKARNLTPTTAGTATRRSVTLR